MKLLRSFGFAWNGLKHSFGAEPNLVIHSFLAIGALIMGFVWRISHTEWLFVLVCIALVFFAELLNTALERLCDLVHPGQHPVVKLVKDISAGAVLLCALFSAIIGTIIFLPYCIQFIKSF